MSKNKITIVYGNDSKRDGTRIFVSKSDFVTSLWQQQQTPIKVLKSIQNSYLIDKSFLESFGYQGISFYWFLYPYLWSEMRTTVNFITEFLKFIEKTNPAIIRVVDFSTFDIIKQITHQKKIKLEYSKLLFLKFTLRKKIGPYVRKYRLQKATKLKIRGRVDRYYKKCKTIHDIHNKIIFASANVYRRDIINLDKGTIEKGEFIVQDIINLINNEKEIVGISLDYDVRGDMNTLSERLESKLSWFPIEVLLKNHDKYDNHKVFFDNYRKLISTKKFQELFRFENILLWKQLEQVFEQMKYAPYFPLLLDLLDSLILTFSTNKPRIIFLLYETGPLALALITACKKFQIKTVGVQHGIIGEDHNYYSFDPIATKNNPYGFPLPDKLLLFGESAKKILIKNGYPSDRLVTFGNPAFFNLDKKKSILASKSFYEKYDIEENQKIILFTTILLQGKNSWSKLDYDVQIWRYLLKNFSGNKNFFIILKPHPGEDTSIYKKILNYFDSSNIKIIQGDTSELISISSIVVSVYSSVIIDAICLKKPVIEVKFDDAESPIPLEKLGVVISSNLDCISEKIHEILQNDKIRNNLFINRDTFLREYYNIPEDRHNLEKILSSILQ